MQGRVGDVIVDANKQGKILVEVDFVQKVVELMEKEEKTTASNDGKKKEKITIEVITCNECMYDKRRSPKDVFAKLQNSNTNV